MVQPPKDEGTDDCDALKLLDSVAAQLAELSAPVSVQTSQDPQDHERLMKERYRLLEERRELDQEIVLLSARSARGPKPSLDSKNDVTAPGVLRDWGNLRQEHCALMEEHLELRRQLEELDTHATDTEDSDTEGKVVSTQDEELPRVAG
eukprot:gnl/MRDRNA2_/MRDRNA2_94617_c0_seq1.p1 gnl/MRDRNA2_/MRDRNA2_94617_c0~~gnl/MRDRNA2_/MRDRNA2_94617_c0_seq1.p1  ORF type:complete len:149 (-),score=37.40 gnl/MRDRNA2_/MRDRNA2_94617_c0_seq1:247-693(-)